MATFRKRNDRWHVQVRRAGYQTLTKSFTSKADAQKWARQVEVDIDSGRYNSPDNVLERTTLRDLMLRYRDEVTLKKRGQSSERIRIDAFLRHSWVHIPLSKLKAQTFASYRDERLKSVKPATVVRELGILRSIIETAQTEWCFPLPENPLTKVKKPKVKDARDRRLMPGELEALLAECENSRVHWLKPAVMLALETAQRRGEILNMRPSHIDTASSTLLIPVTKNGEARRIPLTDRAISLIANDLMPLTNSDAPLINVDANAFRKAWEHCRNRSAKHMPSLRSFRFHDLRHEAISRFFEQGLSVPEVALISGHKDLRMLFRYTHLRAEDLAIKIQSNTTNHGDRDNIRVAVPEEIENFPVSGKVC